MIKIRIAICEILLKAALFVRPDGYEPSVVRHAANQTIAEVRKQLATVNPVKGLGGRGNVG